MTLQSWSNSGFVSLMNSALGGGDSLGIYTTSGSSTVGRATRKASGAPGLPAPNLVHLMQPVKDREKGRSDEG